MNLLEDIITKRKRKSKFVKAFISMAVCIGCITAYMLILPAVTMENNVICGFEEHTHDDSCFITHETKNLLCTQETHEHSDDCYEEVVNQVIHCIHEHNDECIHVTEQKNIICEIDHEHLDECYEVSTNEEIVCLHEHTDDCFEEVSESELICEMHVHDDACYEIIPSEKQAVCEKEEHKHSTSCYATIDSETQAVIDQIEAMPSADEIDAELLKYDENEDYEGYEAYYTEVVKEVVSTYRAYEKLSESDKAKVTNASKLLELEYIWSMHNLADQIDLSPYITDVTVKHREKGQEEWIDVEDGKVNPGEELLFTLHFEIEPYKLSVINNTVVYKVSIKVSNQHAGFVYNGDSRVGTYEISEDGTIAITFYDDYCNSNATGTEIFGHISFESEVNDLDSDNKGNVKIPIKDGVHLQIQGKENTTDDLQVNKSTTEIDVENGTVSYQIEVASANGTGSKVLLTDQMKEIKLDNVNSIQVVDQNGKTVSVVRTATEDGFTLELPQMEENSKYYITYNATLPNYKNLNGAKVVDNEVEVKSTDNENSLLVDCDMTTDTITRDVLSKDGEKTDDTVDWTITINESHLDISGWTLSDKLQGSDYTGKVTITPNPATGNGSISVNLPYTFPNNTKPVTYTATYSTTIDSSDGSTITNMAFLTYPGGKVETEVGVGVRDNEDGLYKKGTGVEVTEHTENGDILANFNWQVTFNATKQALTPYQQEVDGVTRNVWVYSDQIRNEDIHWITGAQLKALKANLTTALSGKYNSTFDVYAYYWDGTGWNPYRDPVLVTDSLPDANKYSQFRILFYGTIAKGNTVDFSYQTTVNLKDGEAAVEVKNVAILNQYEGYNESTQFHSPNVYKEDMMNPQGGSITYHTTEEIYKDWHHTNNGLPGIPRVLGWNIYVTFPDVEYTDDLVIIERLPKGLKFLHELGLETGHKDIAFALGESDLVTGNGHFIFTEDSPNITGFHYGVLDPTNTHGDPYDWVPIILERNDDNTELKFKVPPRIANPLRGKTSKISLLLQIDEDFEWTALSQEFKNTVIINYDGVDYGQASQTQVVEAPIVKKEIDLVNDNVIPYILTINKSGIDLIPGKDTLTVVDELSFEKPENDNVNASLMLDTVKVYTLDQEGNRVEITNQCPFVTEESDDGNKILKKFTMTVPDGKPVIIEYSYRISGKIGTQVEILNNAEIEGHSDVVDEDEKEYDIVIKQSNAGAILVGVKIVKVDSENFGYKLEGAIFRLEKWNSEIGEYEEVKDAFQKNENNLTKDGLPKTDIKGTLSTIDLDPNVAYRFIEVSSPYGYEIDPTPYYFIIDGDAENSIPVDFDGVVLHNGDSITITNKRKPYELPETGGMGTNLYYISGISLVLVSLVAYHFLNKKEECE